MAATEYITKLTVLSATQLPKTDRLSKIDPYIVVKLNGQQYKTTAIQDSEEPVWNQGWVVTLPKGGALIAGSLQLLLYDENMMTDTHVGTATVQLDQLAPAQLARLTVPFTFTKDKFSSQGRAASVTVALEGFIQSYASLRAMFAAMPGFLYSDPARACYIPVTDSNGLIYVGVEYDGTKVDIKAYLTRPGANLYVDMLVLAGKQYTKVYRKTYHQGKQIVPGLTVFEELKLDDLPLSLDYNQLSIMVFDSERLSSTNADRIVTAHGWKGALNFAQAARVLHGVELDYEKEEIYMSVDPQETMLLVDYDRDDADIKLAVLATPTTADKGYDITIRGHSYNKMSELYVPPRMKLQGRLPVCRLFELDDLPYGTRFDDIEIHRFKLSNPRQYTIQGLTRLHG